MTENNAKPGRGGQPAKIVPRWRGGWVTDCMTEQQALNEEIAEFTKKAMASVGAPDEIFPRAFTIMHTYRKQLEFFDNPLATADKNKKGVGRFKSELQRKSQKMADKLNEALNSESSHDLNSLISEGDLRSHMQAAYESLTAIAGLIERAENGTAPPMSQADVRNAAGAKLKALAEKNELRVADFVLAFNVYKGEEVRLCTPHEQEAFDKWLARLGE